MTQPCVPMSGPDITAAEIAAVSQVLQTRYLSIGPRIAEFEECFAAYVGTKYAIAVSSGTAGLHLCVIAAGVSEGDLVITTPFSYPSSPPPMSSSTNAPSPSSWTLTRGC